MATRRRSAATALALVALTCLLAAPVATGAINTVQPVDDEFGTFSDAFMSNQNLWAFTVSDVLGGTVCVVPAAQQNPGNGSLTCKKRKAWGTQNAIKSVVGSRWTLLEPPYLRPGTWRLLADSDSPNGADVLSEEFTVYPCEPGACDRSIALEAAARYKAAAGQMAIAMQGMKGVVEKLDEKNPEEPFGAFKKALNSTVKKAIDKSPSWIRVRAQKQADDRLKFINDIPDGPNHMAMQLLHQVVDGALEMYTDIVEDPPADYAVVAEPAFELPDFSSTDPAVDAMLLDIARMTGYGAAGRKAFERYRLADEEGNAQGVHRQAAAMARFDYALVDEMYSAADGLDAFADSVAADPQWGGQMVTQADIDDIRPAIERVRASGFQAAEIADLQADGLGPTQIEALRDQLAGVTLDGVPVDTPVETVVRSLAATLRDQAPVFDELARNAQAVGESTNSVPQAGFTASATDGAPPLPVTFTDTSTDADGEPLTVAWDFGDGATASGPTVSHTFGVGVHTVTQTVTDGAVSVTATKTITVETPNVPPSASFSVSPTSGRVPLDVAFDASASGDPDGTIVDYAWRFGDGGTASGPSPSHTFETPGQYAVVLIVTDDRGGTASHSEAVTARPPNQAPTASMGTSQTAGHAPLAVHFEGGGSSDADGTIVSYRWDFGDGGSATGPKADHVFAQGSSVVTLTVTDDEGAVGTAVTAVNATENLPPVASFTRTPDSGPPPLEVAFSDTSSDPDTDPLTVTWDFGDGGSATGANVSHTYAHGGRFTVTETVSDGLASATETHDVRVTAPPVAAFTRTPATGEAPLDVAFDASGSTDADGSIASYEWTFGDGAGAPPGNAATITHTYERGGTFTATLTVTDDVGETDTETATVTVLAPPTLGDDQLLIVGRGSLDVLANDRHPNGGTMDVVAASDPEHGTATCAREGSCTYVADAGYQGADTFTYTVRDGRGKESTATVHVTVQPPDAPAPAAPVAVDDELQTPSGTAVDVAPLANDRGTAPLALKAHGDAQHGAVTCDLPAGTCRYVPAAGFAGTDGFTYEIADANERKASAAVHVLVGPTDAGFPVSLSGRPAGTGAAVREGEKARWAASAGAAPDGVDAAALGALPAPELTTTLSGPHAVDPASVHTAKGWTLVAGGAPRARAGAGALLGESVSDILPRPLPPASQGTGGDGHVPILVGNKVYAFFHHSSPTSVTCLDRRTGALCPGYPHAVEVSSGDIIGPAAVVGSRLYVHALPSSAYAQSASIALYCWDTSTDRPCGLTILDRIPRLLNPGGSAPVLVGGKIYLAADSGRLYCFDPATERPCATPSLPLAMGPVSDPSYYDILANGSLVYVSRPGALECVDVAAGGPCAGWSGARDLGGQVNIVRRHAPGGAVTGICLVGGSFAPGTCFDDGKPSQTTEITGWPGLEQYWSITSEAESGTRTIIPTAFGATACWDWVTSAPCAGGGFTDGLAWTDIDGKALPGAYGMAWDGTCAVGLGDPGLVFTISPTGTSPCTSLRTGTEPRAVDLRDQRCDGGVGGARWSHVALLDTPASGAGAELASLVVTVRDKGTGAVLATKELIGSNGRLDLSGVSAADHPAITVDATAVSVSGDPAWQDGVPPRLRLVWDSDPQQLCFETTVAMRCPDPLSPVGVTAGLTGAATRTQTLSTLRSAACNVAPALELGGDREVDEETTLRVDPAASDPEGRALAFSLLEGPEGATIDPATGRVTWTPSERQGPGSYALRVRATDAGSAADPRHLTADDALTLRVREVNRPPVLEPIADRVLDAGGHLATGPATASDPDVPANRLVFSLPLAPPGPVVDPATGAVTWSPGGAGAFAFTLRVTDDGSPPLSAERRFGVTVASAPQDRAGLLLACSDREVVIEDVVRRGAKVEVLGVADPRLAGKTAEIVYDATRKVVGRPKVAADGSFRALVPLPPARQRNGNLARYRARIGVQSSLSLKLTRRMVVTAIAVAGRRATIRGTVTPPLAKKPGDRTIELRQRVACGQETVVAKVEPRADGSFTAAVIAPADAAAAVYRLRTKVRISTRSAKTANTFTMPRAVEFGG